MCVLLIWRTGSRYSIRGTHTSQCSYQILRYWGVVKIVTNTEMYNCCILALSDASRFLSRENKRDVTSYMTLSDIWTASCQMSYCWEKLLSLVRFFTYIHWLHTTVISRSSQNECNLKMIHLCHRYMIWIYSADARCWQCSQLENKLHSQMR